MKGNNFRESKKERIADSAMKLFANADFTSVSMDEIAHKANVAKGTLYNYFYSKEDLYVKIILQRFEKLASILDGAFGSRNQPWRDLRSFVIHYEAFMCKHPHFFKLWRRMRTEPSFVNMFEELEHRIVGLLTGVIKKGMRSKEFRNGSAEFCARLVLGMVEREIEHRIYKGIRRRKADEIVEFLKTGLVGANNVGTERRAAR